jgi:RAT1-interacting protein
MLGIIKFKGTYFLCEIETELAKKSELEMDEKGKQFSYWGHKFEPYITSDYSDCEEIRLDDIEHTADTGDQFVSVINSNLNNKSLLYGAEVDCCFKRKHENLSDYCELKTSVGDSLASLPFERNIKFLKWWLQSYISGIPKIIIGLRNNDGFVNKIVECSVDHIYKSNNNVSFIFSFFF